MRQSSTILFTEIRRINAMMAALNGLMPMLGYACYSPIYYNTVDVLPAAQFFFAAGLNAIIIVLFIIIQVRQSSPISPEDLEVAPEKEDKDGPGNSKTLTLSSPGKSRDSHKCNDSPTLQQLSYAKKNTKELTSSLPPVPSECYSVGDCATRHMVQNRSEGSGMLQQQLQLTWSGEAENTTSCTALGRNTEEQVEESDYF
ncbi:uncharacterized protein LOC121872126 [Homarus americanus]|uniref:uncharacterized protein LOC121872126 n=1 Tax=Homarus americanus TaxID=6706 RepID=UPI001C48874B|nr:uncharacterized protein LOC121872126 [Homarus americanus]